MHLGVELTGSMPTVYQVFAGEKTLAEVRHLVAPNLWVVPSNLELAAVEMELANVADRELILREALQQLARTEPLDYIVIDCPPSLGVLTINALTAVKEVFIPLQPHFFALQGLSKLLERRGDLPVRDRHAIGQRRDRRPDQLPTSQRSKCSVGERPHLPDEGPSQHQACGSAEFWAVDLRLRTQIGRRAGLPVDDRGSPGDGNRRLGPAGGVSRRVESQGEAHRLACPLAVVDACDAS
ncbi:MAG: chromosome partitioning protein [Planctomycetota bacterium]|nr:MAG: chromosome partitioning protein [Planctomycetota bacterium]